MATRIVAIVMLALVVGFIALLASVTFFVRDPIPVISPRSGPAMLVSETAGPSVQIALDAGYRVQVNLRGFGAGAQDALPQVHLAPDAQDGQPIALELARLESGEIIVTGQLTRPGRWTLTLRHGEMRLSQGFVVQE